MHRLIRPVVRHVLQRRVRDVTTRGGARLQMFQARLVLSDLKPAMQSAQAVQLALTVAAAPRQTWLLPVSSHRMASAQTALLWTAGSTVAVHSPICGSWLQCAGLLKQLIHRGVSAVRFGKPASPGLLMWGTAAMQTPILAGLQHDVTASCRSQRLTRGWALSGFQMWGAARLCSNSWYSLMWCLRRAGGIHLSEVAP